MNKITDFLQPKILKAGVIKGIHNVTVEHAEVVMEKPYKSDIEEPFLALWFKEYPKQRFLVGNQTNKDFIRNRYGDDLDNLGAECMGGKVMGITTKTWENGNEGIVLVPRLHEDEVKQPDEDVPFRGVAQHPQANTAGEAEEKGRLAREEMAAILEDDKAHLQEVGTDQVIKENFDGYSDPRYS